MKEVCVITGGGSGMGLATAKFIKDRLVIISGRTESKLAKACEELKEARAKREAINHDALIAAFTKSTKTYEEVMAFLEEGMKADPEEKPKRRGRRRKQV